MPSTIKLLTTKELMEKLKVKRNTIYQLRKEADMPTIKLGRTIRFDENEIDKWLKSRQVYGPAGIEEWEECEAV
jgi:excisionase family DNA binding protein